MKMLIIITACLFLTSSATAQTWLYRHYTTRDGLSHANVFRIMQDSAGYIWMATDAGLSRFNSKTFENYYVEDGLSDNCIMSMSEGADGTQYICTYFNGISVRQKDVIKKLEPAYGIIPDKTLFAFPHQHALWIIAQDTARSLFLMQRDSVRKISATDKDGNGLLFFNGYETPHGLLFTTNSGIVSVNENNELVPFLDSLIKERVYAIAYGRDDDALWIATATHLMQIRNGSIMTEIALAPSMAVSDILADHENTVWVAIVGLGMYKIAGAKLISVQEHLGLNTTIVNDLFEDREGNMWIATHGEGVFKISDKHIAQYAIGKHVLNVYCTDLSFCKDGIIASSIGRINVLNRKGILQPLSSSLLQPSNYIYFAREYDGYVYIGTTYGLIRKKTTPPFREERITLKDGSSVGSIAIFRDAKNNIWVGGYQGLYRMEGDHLVQIPLNDHPAFRRINDLAESSSGTIWIGTDSILISYDGSIFKELPVYYGRRGVRVLAIYEDHNQRLWIGTNNGLAYYDKGAIHFIGERNIVIRAITEDNKGKIWLGTSSGLQYSDNPVSEWHNYYQDALHEDVLSLLVTDSCLYAGTTTGILVIQPSFMQKDTMVLPTYITTVSSDTQTFTHPGTIILPYRNQKLTISFIALNFKDPEHTLYRYKIKELDNVWHETQNTSIDFARLAPGAYTFLLSSKRPGGVWQAATSLEIYVATPFWKRWWFFLSGFAILLTGILLAGKSIFTRKERRKRQRLELESKVTHLKQQALHALINPHFIFNCMNAIQHYINEHEHEAANEYLSSFARLIRMTMEHATASFILMEKELERIQLYVGLEQLRFGEDLKFRLYIGEGVNVAQLWIPNMLLQPYIENAIWHGIMPNDGRGVIDLRIEQIRDQVKITIGDNGVGFDASNNKNSHKKSMGMKLIRERLNLLQGLLNMEFAVTVYAGNSKGTFVEIVLPVIRNEISI